MTKTSRALFEDRHASECGQDHHLVSHAAASVKAICRSVCLLTMASCCSTATWTPAWRVSRLRPLRARRRCGAAPAPAEAGAAPPRDSANWTGRGMSRGRGLWDEVGARSSISKAKGVLPHHYVLVWAAGFRVGVISSSSRAGAVIGVESNGISSEPGRKSNCHGSASILAPSVWSAATARSHRSCAGRFRDRAVSFTGCLSTLLRSASPLSCASLRPDASLRRISKSRSRGRRTPFSIRAE